MRAFGLSALALLCLSGAVSAQTIAMSSGSAPAANIQTAPGSADRNIHLDISVHSGSGQPAPALSESDLTLLDNNHPLTLSSFKTVVAGQAPAEIIFVMDAANVRYTNLDYQMEQLQSFLRKAGKLPHPATVAVLTDKSMEILPGFSRDGGELSKALDGYKTNLRAIRQNSGWGAKEQVEIGLNAFTQLMGYAKKLPGRKFVFWLSPGWPLLSSMGSADNGKEQQKIFAKIVQFSDVMRAERVTMYDIDPFGLRQSLDYATYYKAFVKGVRKPNETEFGNLGLQVLAVQSGGRTVTTNDDVESTLKEWVAETESWYEAVFPMAPADGPNEYHHLEVKVTGGQASLTARTRDGYYAQPTVQP